MKRIYLHPLPLRIWHWVNASLFLVLLVTGLQLRIPGVPSVGPRHPALWLHKYAGFAASGSFVFWLFYVALSGAFWRHYLIRPADIMGMPKQAAFYGFTIFRGKENPFTPSARSKFNPMQKLAYFSMMTVVTPVIVITGVLFSDILYFLPYIEAIGGLRILDAIHVIAAYFFLLYLLVHLYMATLGHSFFAHFKAMIVGYEEEPGPAPRHEA